MSMSANMDIRDHSWARIPPPPQKSSALTLKADPSSDYINGKEVARLLKLSWKDRSTEHSTSIFAHKKIHVVRKDSTNEPKFVKIRDLAFALGVSSGVIRDRGYLKALNASKTPPDAVKAVAAPVFKKIDHLSSSLSKSYSSDGLSSKLSSATSQSSSDVDSYTSSSESSFEDSSIVDSSVFVKKEGIVARKDLPLELATGIDELSRAIDTFFKPKAQAFLEESNFMEFADKLVLSLRGVVLNPYEKMGLRTLIHTVGIDKVKELLTSFPGKLVIKEDSTVNPKIDPLMRMVKTLIVAGHKIEERNAKPGGNRVTEQFHKLKNQTFSFIIDGNNKVYITTDVVGKGGYKKVSRTIELSTLDEYVRPAVVGAEAIEETKEEIKILEALYTNRFPNIVVPYKFSFASETKGNQEKLVMLHRKYDGDGKTLRGYPRQAIKALSDCAKGLAGLHVNRLVHGDFKPANFLIEGDPNSKQPIKAKLADFGGLAKVDENVRIYTRRYAPPERVLNKVKILSDKWDSFSLGVSLFELIFVDSTPTPNTLIDIHLNTGLGGEKPAVLEAELKKLEVTGPSITSQQELNNAVLKVMIELLKGDPKDRMSCADAAAALDQILVLHSR